MDGWMRNVTGIDDNGAEIDVRDPLRDEITSAYRQLVKPGAKRNHQLISPVNGRQLAGTSLEIWTGAPSFNDCPAASARLIAASPSFTVT